MDESPFPQHASSAPAELAALLQARDAESRERAWGKFLDRYSRLILHGARSLGSDYDAVMDRYTLIVEQLRDGDFRRLRSYVADGRGKFTTWLTVVVRRICLDHHRQRYGRAREGVRTQVEGAQGRAARRRERAGRWDAGAQWFARWGGWVRRPLIIGKADTLTIGQAVRRSLFAGPPHRRPLRRHCQLFVGWHG